MRRAARWPSYRLRRFCRGPEEVGRPPEDYIGYFPWRVCRARALFCLRIVDRGNEAKTKNQLQPSMRSTFSPRCRTCLSISEAISRSSSITARYGSAVKSVSGSIGGYRREDRASDRWSAIYCGWAFWLVRGTGLLPWPHNLAMIDYGAGVAALGIGLVWFGWQ